MNLTLNNLERLICQKTQPTKIAQSAGAVEYTDYFSAEG